MITRARQMWPKLQPRRPREPKAPKHSRSGPSAAVRRKVWARSRRCCERCGVTCTTFYRTVGEIHHRRNRSQGVDNSLCNLVLLCHLCHVWVGSDPTAAHDKGFHLAHGQAPGKTRLHYGGPEVEYYGRRWATLTAVGSVEFSPENTNTEGEMDDR